MQYKRVTEKDIPILKQLMECSPYRQCDYTVGATVMWSEYFNIAYAVCENILFMSQDGPEGDTYFYLPLGNAEKGVKMLINDCKGNVLKMWAVPESELPLFERMGLPFTAREQREYFDYLYRAEDFVKAEGKGFKNVRNHIHKFEQTVPEWRFEELTAQNMCKVWEYYEKRLQMDREATDLRRADAEKTREVLKNIQYYPFEGGVLYENDAVIGFTLGEVQKDTLFVHVEKASKDITGSYQMLSRCFAEHCAEKYDFEYINREEDMGDEGLRRSKLSYNPTALLKKYVAEIRLGEKNA